MKKLILLLILAFACVFGLTACDEEAKELSPELKAGQSIVKQLYEKASAETPSDYIVVGSAAKCTVTWSVNVKEGNPEDVKVVVNEDGTVKIDVNEKADSDVHYTLTATISYNNETTTLSYERKVPKFQELSYAEYAKKEKGDAVVVKGIVVGILRKDLGDTVDGLYLHTPQGGFYVYGVANTADVPMTSYQLGQEVRASGTMDIYSGTLEVKDATCEILNATPVAYEAVDYTDAFTNAADISLEKIGVPQAMLVTLKNVVISDIDASNGYYNFTLGGKKSYVRISSSTCPLNAADTKTFQEGWAAHVGWTADVTGVVSIYNGNFYLQPVTLASAATYKSLPVLNDADAVAFEKGNLKVNEKAFVDGAEVELPLTGAGYSDVTISWESNSENVVIENGVAKVTVDNQNINLVLTATLSRGEATETREFSFTVFALPITVTELAATEKGEQVLVKGYIDEVANATYGNIYITDGKTRYYVYGLYDSNNVRHDKWAEADRIQLGEVVTLLGTASEFNGSPQLANAVLISRTSSVALDAVAGLADNTNVVVKGTITEIKNAKYGNIYITDGTNTLYIYGVNNFAGQRHEYWDEADKLAVGDVVVLEGPKTTHEGTAQIKSATLISASEPAAEKPELDTDFETTDFQTLNDMVDATTANSTEAYYAIGYVKSISSYGDVVLEDAEGKILNTYGLWSFDKKLKGNNIAHKFAVGDVVVVYGKMNHYADKSLDQMKDALLVQVGTVVCTEDDAHKAGVTAYETKVAENADANFTLDVVGKTYNTVTISWASNNAAIVVDGANATVVRPAVGEENATVKLTATITSGEKVITKVYTVTVPAELPANVLKDTLESDGSKTYVSIAQSSDEGDSTDFASTLGLDANLFTVTFATSGCTNEAGIARFNTSSSYLQLYADAELKVTAKEGVTIASITITLYEAKDINVNGTAVGNATTKTVDINGTSFVIHNTNTAQMKIKSIEIVYSTAE